MIPWQRWQPRAGVLLWLGLSLPQSRQLLEGSMAAQMLVQIPLLAVAGWWSAAYLPGKARNMLGAWNRSGISGLLLASMLGLVWMLPRAMDASVEIPWVEWAKFSSVPALLGLPLALSWPRAGFVARGVFLAEAIATAFRMGWLYRVSPVRLCRNYLLADQQMLGQMLLAIGVAACAMAAWHLLAGRPDRGAPSGAGKPRG